MLVDLFMESVRRRGKITAVSDARTSLSYDRLLRFARVVRDLVRGETRADKVGLMLPASAAFSGCFFGTLWASRTVVPLNFLLSATELAGIVSRSEIDVILTVKHFQELSSGLGVRSLFLEDLGIKRKIIAATFRRTPPPPQVSPDDTAVLLFTSGTSAEPKGVELTYNNLRSNCEDCIATARMHPDHRFLNCIPPFHVFGLTANVIAPAVLGASVYCIPRFSPTAVAAAIRDQAVSIFMAIPSMHASLLRLKSAPADLMKSTYLVVSGGEPLTEPVREGFRQRFGIDLLQGYGLTETSPVCTLELPEAKKAGSIGRPIRNVSVRVVDAQGGDVPAGQEGEIWIKGPNVMKGYYKAPEETRRTITAEGWFKTGDAGYMDEHRFVTLTGRLKEMLIIGGENVYPREIEAVLEGHPAVGEVAVVGIPDSSRGEVPVAFVICKEGTTTSEVELREFARKHLAGYKVPRQVRLESDLPRGPTGKVLKRKLLDML